jgi:predicted DCC family thiol-disulfide oxidoreductase YuxK
MLGSATEPEADRLFYDGHCGFCHGTVRFVLARDHRAQPFQFAPLDGAAFRSRVPAARRAGLPDSIIVVTKDGAFLTRSAAVIYIGMQLGGVWRVLASIARLVPSPIRDAVYDVIARVRRHLVAMPDDVCPLVPPHLRARFER